MEFNPCARAREHWRPEEHTAPARLAHAHNIKHTDNRGPAVLEVVDCFLVQHFSSLLRSDGRIRMVARIVRMQQRANCIAFEVTPATNGMQFCCTCKRTLRARTQCDCCDCYKFRRFEKKGRKIEMKGLYSAALNLFKSTPQHSLLLLYCKLINIPKAGLD